MHGHFWTVVPRLRLRRAATQLRDAPWRGVVVDPARGAIPLGGWFWPGNTHDLLVVLLHGLGGSAASPYVTATAAACQAAGLPTLRLGLRGSDGKAGDFYHAGLTADLAAALASPELAAFSQVLVVGFSLGGHVALRYATETHDQRLTAVAAVCAPLELGIAQRSFDRRVLAAWPYRVYILGRLKRLYAEIATHGAVPTPVAQVHRVRTLRDFDRLTVAPRFGFTSPEDYYTRASVGPRLRQLSVPAMLVASPRDPMVPEACIAAAAAAAGDALEVRWVRGGHVGFPPGLDLGYDGARGLPGQLAAWARHAGAGDFSSRGLSEPPRRAGLPAAAL
ncbi:MAG TPA: alpha/beta fold hydrolase [Thermoanaerobaculia bacterium]|nr:alpha/beta fold hydrolase [Thermoanaerobaculia bacterium]